MSPIQGLSQPLLSLEDADSDSLNLKSRNRFDVFILHKLIFKHGSFNGLILV